MDSQELVRLLEAGDLYGLMLKTVRMWATRDHPEVKDLILLGEFGRDLPTIQVPIMLAASSPASSSHH